MDGRRSEVWIAVAVGAGLLAAAVAVVGLWPELRTPGPNPPSAIVLQHWNRLAEPESRVTHTAFAPGALAGTVLASLPRNAVSVRWAPNGGRVVYFAIEVTERLGGLGRGPRMGATGMVIADGNGTNPVELALPRPVDHYPSHAWFAGVLWAPNGAGFAAPWSTFECQGNDCIPPGGIDVFDRAGRLVVSVPTPDNVNIGAFWSADGRAIGWTSGSCANSSCMDDALHWRAIEGDPRVTTVDGTFGGIVWAPDGRIHAVTFDEDGITGLLTMAPDGSDARPLAWPLGPNWVGPAWSPNGRWLAELDDQTGAFRARDAVAGTDVSATLRAGLSFVGWSPDGNRIALSGESPDGVANRFWAINADGTGLVELGDGEDFGWMPAGPLP